MLNKDKILKSFLSHELLISKYHLEPSDFPETVRVAKESKIPIIKTIALIVDEIESGVVTDKILKTKIITYLNEAAI
jgi:hypothetical protein